MSSTESKKKKVIDAHAALLADSTGLDLEDCKALIGETVGKLIAIEEKGKSKAK